MLRQRVITAVLLLPLTLAVILLAPMWLFDGVVALVLGALAVEFAALCRSGMAGRALFALVVVALFASAVLPWHYAQVAGNALILGAVLLWLLAPLWLATRSALPGAVKLFLGLPMLAGTGVALHALKLADTNGGWVLLALLVVWAADVGAYAAGRTFGRHKLAPRISPGKTWEGFAGGIVLVLVVGAFVGTALIEQRHWLSWAVLLVVLTVLSVVGDLLESLLKRQAGVKDSGRLLPGHGGLLDRLDSLLAVAPVFLLAGSKIGIFGELSSYGL